jgi:hypothetical protein
MSMIANKTSATTVTFSTPQEIVISHLDDSIRLGDGSQIFTGGSKADSASIPVTQSTEDKAVQSSISSSLTSIDSKLTAPISTTVKNTSTVSTASRSATGILYSGDVSDYSSIGIQLTGTFSATVSIYASNDNSNWVALNIQTQTIGTQTISQTINATNQLYSTGVNFKYFKAEVTSYTSGTVNIYLFFTTSEIDIPGAQVVGVSGAVSALGYGNDWGVYSSSALNGVVTPAVAWYTYSKAGFQVYGTWSATIICEVSNDNSNWNQVNLYNKADGTTVSSITTNGFYYIPIESVYMRLKISVYTSGTVSCRTMTNQNSSHALASSGGGDATAANQVLQTTELQDINTELNTQTTSLGSLLTELQLKADLTETQPVSVASLPLPTGASTEAKQDTQITELQAINTELDTQTAKLVDIETAINGIPLATEVDARVKDYVHGKDTAFSAFGQIKTAQETVIGDLRFYEDSIGDLFDFYNVGSAGYSIEEGGTGARIYVNASANTSMCMISKEKYYYQSGRGYMLKQSIITDDAGLSGTIREWGLIDEYQGDNGAFLRLSGTTLSWVIKRNGVETVINASAWDTPVTHDGNGHIWYIQMEWLGVGNMYLYHDEVLVHTYSFLGTSTEFSIGTPDLRVFYHIENTTNVTAIYTKFGCASVITEGNPNAVRINQAPRDTDLAVLNKTVLTGKSGDDIYRNIAASDLDELKTLSRLDPIQNGQTTTKIAMIEMYLKRINKQLEALTGIQGD